MSIRRISFNDTEITAFKENTTYFPFEILLPRNYFVINGGSEQLGLDFINQDPNRELNEYSNFKSMKYTGKFNCKVIIVNLEPGVIEEKIAYVFSQFNAEKCEFTFSEDYSSIDNKLKLLASKCSAVILSYFEDEEKGFDHSNYSYGLKSIEYIYCANGGEDFETKRPNCEVFIGQDYFHKVLKEEY